MATAVPPGAIQEVSLPQGTVSYSDQGTGPTLVFVHGLLANHLPRRAFVPLDQPEVLAQHITEFVHAHV